MEKWLAFLTGGILTQATATLVLAGKDPTTAKAMVAQFLCDWYEWQRQVVASKDWPSSGLLAGLGGLAQLIPGLGPILANLLGQTPVSPAVQPSPVVAPQAPHSVTAPPSITGGWYAPNLPRPQGGPQAN